jgi:hypothetical protein
LAHEKYSRMKITDVNNFKKVYHSLNVRNSLS